jgi:hypothetical protein
VDFAHVLGSGALFEARSWEEVGIGSPTQNIYKTEVFDNHGRFILA